MKTANTWNRPIDRPTIEAGLRAGRRERAKAMRDLLARVFSAPTAHGKERPAEPRLARRPQVS